MLLEFIKSVSIANYRSIIGEVTVPLDSRITLLVGPNNTGKSNLLRSLAVLFNSENKTLSDELDYSNPSRTVTTFRLVCEHAAFSKLADSRPHLEHALQGAEPDARFTIKTDFNKSEIRLSLEDDIDSVLTNNYVGGSRFLDEFGASGSRAHNLGHLLQQLRPLDDISGTVSVPSVRFVTNQGAAVPHFGQSPFPGKIINFGGVVRDLAVMCAPSGAAEDRQKMRSSLREINTFMQFCLEMQSVEIQIPHDQSTILVTIDGNEQPISNLGSGIEQLLILGVASIGFPGKLVLIDEPELHFHPRTQKRMMQYLSEAASCKLLIATHSAAILDATESSIVQILPDDRECKARTVSSNNHRFQAVKDLGHSPSELVQSNFVIWVEGPSDRIYLLFWILRLDPSLVEGVDFSILFYGGSILAHHSYADDESDLVKALSICRQFAIYADSDKREDTTPLKARIERVSEEVKKLGALCWISDGREIENYVPHKTITMLAVSRPSVKAPKSKYDQVLTDGSTDKVSFARLATENWGEDWPLDLKERVGDLVKRILEAR